MVTRNALKSERVVLILMFASCAVEPPMTAATKVLGPGA